MDQQPESPKRKHLTKDSFQTDIKSAIELFNSNTFLELRLALPFALIVKDDKLTTGEEVITTKIDWIDDNDKSILVVINVIQFEISSYAENGYRLALSLELTEYDGSMYDQAVGYDYTTIKGQPAIIEKNIVDINNLKDHLLEFINYCNKFYILHCKPYDEPL